MQNDSTTLFDNEIFVSFPCPHCFVPIALRYEWPKASPFDPALSVLLDNLLIAEEALLAARRLVEGRI
jgi:hypothetical protein